MNEHDYICNTSTITYSKGYIALRLGHFDIPETFEVAGETFLRKTNFHVSLLCVKNILETNPKLEAEILQHFCTFMQDREMKFEGFTKEFRQAENEERKSIVALCNISNLHLFAEYLSEKIGIPVAPQPAHVTLYTLQLDAGIGLNSREEMERKSSPIEVPEAILAPLMGYKKIIVVDEQDNEIGTEYMMDAIKKGMIRRASRVYVFNESDQLLVQQRSAKVLKPLLLDQSAAGHVDIGETYEQAAYRELREELGLENVELQLVATSFRTTGFYNAIYKAVVRDDTQIQYDVEELNAVLWYDVDTLDDEMQEAPEKFTPAFKEVWLVLKEKLTNA